MAVKHASRVWLNNVSSFRRAARTVLLGFRCSLQFICQSDERIQFSIWVTFSAAFVGMFLIDDWSIILWVHVKNCALNCQVPEPACRDCRLHAPDV